MHEKHIAIEVTCRKHPKTDSSTKRLHVKKSSRDPLSPTLHVHSVCVFFFSLIFPLGFSLPHGDLLVNHSKRLRKIECRQMTWTVSDLNWSLWACDLFGDSVTSFSDFKDTNGSGPGRIRLVRSSSLPTGDRKKVASG